MAALSKTFLLAGVLALGLAPTLTPVALADERGGVVRTVLGGSFFPFARSMGPKASPRCESMADRMRGRRDDNILNVTDLRRLRSAGCQNVRPY